MTNTERDKAICVALGIEWHEDLGGGRCSCGEKFHGSVSQHLYLHANPDFSIDSGKVLLLREVMKLEDWQDFLIFNAKEVIELITDTTGKFALEVYDWFVRTGRIK